MTRFLADEDFNNDILRGLARRIAGLDLVRCETSVSAGPTTMPCWRSPAQKSASY